MTLRWPFPRTLAAVLFVGFVAGCATVPTGSAAIDTENDPFEPLNRNVFAVNLAVDRALIKPVAKTYRSVLPEALRDRLRAFFDNLHEPITFVNDLLQGRGEAAGITGRRFIINSTWGLAGFFDRAGELGMPKQSGDFGQTLFAWGVGDGPFLMLPLFGPSNVRDAIGLGADAYASPFTRAGSEGTQRKVAASTGITDGIDQRSRNIESLESIENNAVDFYANLRSVWRQNRQSTLREARDAGPDDDLVDPGAIKPAVPAR